MKLEHEQILAKKAAEVVRENKDTVLNNPETIPALEAKERIEQEAHNLHLKRIFSQMPEYKKDSDLLSQTTASPQHKHTNPSTNPIDDSNKDHSNKKASPNNPHNKGPYYSHKTSAARKKRSKTGTAGDKADKKTPFSNKSKIIIISLFAVAAVCLIAILIRLVSIAEFDYTLRQVYAIETHTVAASEFLTNDSIDAGITAELIFPVITDRAGQQQVSLRLRRGLLSLETTGNLFVLTPVEYFFHEYLEPAPLLTPVDLLSNGGDTQNDLVGLRFIDTPAPLDEFPVGTHELSLALNGIPFTVPLVVADTKAPTATPVIVTLPIASDPDAAEFVSNIFDASEISSIDFVREPDMFQSGRQSVEIAIEDEFGNVAVIQTDLFIVTDDTPPVILGADESITLTIGSSVAYRAGVTAFDSFGRPLDIEVDSSSVDLHTRGIYTVIYTANDYSGNQTQLERKVHVVTFDPEEVFEQVDAVLAEILREDMTQVEQVRTIFFWIIRNVSYVGSNGGAQSVYEGAQIALRDRRGNCFIYYSLGEIMLTRAGIPNMRIERIPIPGVSSHYWNLINPDNRGWHHFDATPIRQPLTFRNQMYMFNDRQAAVFAEQLELVGSSPQYFTYDPALYPPIVG